MHPIALSAGHTVPLDGLCGRVHSVFRRACNMKLANGALITLLARELGDIPQGIRLGTWPGFTFADAGLQAGQAVVCQAGVIRVEGSPLEIDLRPVAYLALGSDDDTGRYGRSVDPACLGGQPGKSCWRGTPWVSWQRLQPVHL